MLGWARQSKCRMRFVVLRILRYCVAPERCLSAEQRRRRASSFCICNLPRGGGDNILPGTSPHVKMLGERGVASTMCQRLKMRRYPTMDEFPTFTLMKENDYCRRLYPAFLQALVCHTTQPPVCQGGKIWGDHHHT